MLKRKIWTNNSVRCLLSKLDRLDRNACVVCVVCRVLCVVCVVCLSIFVFLFFVFLLHALLVCNARRHDGLNALNDQWDNAAFIFSPKNAPVSPLSVMLFHFLSTVVGSE